MIQTRRTLKYSPLIVKIPSGIPGTNYMENEHVTYRLAIFSNASCATLFKTNLKNAPDHGE